MKHVAFAFLLLSLAAPATAADLVVQVERLRNERGVVHLCLTRNATHFPDCGSDPTAVKNTVPAAATIVVRFTGIEAGRWALSVFHDQNRNERLDTMVGIPREGFGFSRNPAISFRAPRFDQVVLDLGAGITRQTVRMQYLL